MENDNMREKIISCLKEIKGDYFSEEEHLLTDQWLDSFDLIRNVNLLENTLNVKIPMDQVGVEHFDSVERIQLLLQRLQENKDD